MTAGSRLRRRPPGSQFDSLVQGGEKMSRQRRYAYPAIHMISQCIWLVYGRSG